MAQTKRTLADIYALLADNVSGDIAAVDVRDAIDTIQPNFGQIYVATPAATVIADTVTYYPVLGTWALGSSTDWDMNVNGQLRYTGAPARFALGMNTGSLTTASNNQVLEIGIALNGTVDPASLIQRKTGTGSDVGTGALMSIQPVNTNDYLSLVVRNTTSATNATFVNGHLICVGFAA